MNARLNRRIWRHEGGAEAVEIIALIAVCIALLAAIGLGFNARGSDLGAAAVGTLTRFASEQSPNIGNVAIDGPDVQGPGISPITAPAIGIPRIVVQPPRVSGPAQPQQSAYQPVQQAPAQQGSGNPLLDFWNSLTGWVQGAILGLAGAAVAVVAFLGLVAAGVITVASGVVLAAIAAVALAVGAIAGAIYVVATGRVDAWQIVLLGFGAASAVLIPIGLALRFPAVAAFFSSIPARIAALWSQRIAPFLVSVWNGIKSGAQWMWNGIKSGWQWVWRNLDTKFRPCPLPWEIKITDVISNLIKYFLLAAFFKEIWLAGNHLPLWQWIAFTVFAVISAYLPAGGIGRIVMKAFYDFVAVWITGGTKFFDSFWKRIKGTGTTSPSTPTPTPTPSPTPTPPPPPTPTPGLPSKP
ncbi:MAG: hypothetical protein C0183_21680 [Roseiflexus castenholzii]|nr:MAG: hypothetical protein C0183_21680 [Roseiflexus castenholzii]